MIKKIIFLLILILSLFFVSATFMHQPGCEEICEDEFTDELKDYCLEEWGDYPLLGSECLNDHIGDYAQECLDEFDDYVDDEGADPSAAEQCLWDNSEYYSDRCKEDFEDEVKELCWDWFGDDMIRNCDQFIDDSLVRGSTPECCEYEDQFYVEDLGECLDYEQAVCQELGMCQYDGDDYCSGLPSHEDDECVSFEQAYCEETDGIWDDGYCISDGVEYDQFVCANGNDGIWVENAEYCAETEDEAMCVENDYYWSEELFECYEENEELECNEEGLFWFEGECIESEEVYECAQEGTFYCENLDECVESEEECCEEEGLYLEMEGYCADNSEMAECINDGLYWSEDEEECFDLEEEADCVSNGFEWDSFLDECNTNEELINCENNGYHWSNGKCREFEEVYKCEIEGAYYCDSENTCVESKRECCSNKDLYIESEGTCATSINEAICINKGLSWSSETKDCFDPTAKANCIARGYTWSERSKTCLNNSKKIECENLEYYWVNNKCVEFKEIFDCQSINKLYCASSDSCVNSKTQCCTSSNLYINVSGICETNPKIAKCENDGLYWSLTDKTCIDLTKKTNCQIRGYNYDSVTNTCLDTQEKIDCKQNDYYWFNEECLEFGVVFDCLSIGQFYCDEKNKCVNTKSQCCPNDTTVYDKLSGTCELIKTNPGLKPIDKNLVQLDRNLELNQTNKYKVTSEKLLNSNNRLFIIGETLRNNKDLLKNYSCEDYKEIVNLMNKPKLVLNKLQKENSLLGINNKYSKLTESEVKTIYNLLKNICPLKTKEDLLKTNDKNEILNLSQEKIISAILKTNPIINITGVYEDGEKEDFYADLSKGIQFSTGKSQKASIEFQITEQDLKNILLNQNPKDSFYSLIKSNSIETKILPRKVIAFRKAIDRFNTFGRK